MNVSMETLLDALLTFSSKDALTKTAMGQASQRMIQPWGLQQFVRGSLQAISYARSNKKDCRSMQARFVLRNWKGRYRPV